MRQLGTLDPTVLVDFSAVKGRQPTARNFTYDGHALLLFVDDADLDVIRGRTRETPLHELWAARPYDALFVEHDGTQVVQEVLLRDVAVGDPVVTRLPSGEPVVGGVYQDPAFGREHEHHHVTIFDAGGAAVSLFDIGDCVVDIEADRGGELWVTYHEEGIFGPRPHESAGIVRFDREGDVTWSFPHDQGVRSPCDLPMISVTADEVWTTYYTEYEAVRIRDGIVTAWTNDVVPHASPTGLDEGHVLLQGNAGPITLARLGDDGALHALGTYDAGPWGLLNRWGSDVHLVDGDVWAKLPVDQLHRR